MTRTPPKKLRVSLDRSIEPLRTQLAGFAPFLGKGYGRTIGSCRYVKAHPCSQPFALGSCHNWVARGSKGIVRLPLARR